MKKTTIILISVVAVIAIIILFFISKYNGIVVLDEEVNGQWSKVENQYQRRADLIPNLVKVVKGYAKHESETFENVIAARSKATQLTVNSENLTPEKLQEFQAAQGQLSSALSKLLMITENYPDLKANKNFLELQSQLEGTENRIATERSRFINMTKNFNEVIRKFPTNIIASMFGFEKKDYFETDKKNNITPEVDL